MSQKRSRTTGSYSSEEEKTFAKSQKVLRSPEYAQNKVATETKMDEMKEMLKDMMQELKRNTTELKEIKEELKRKEDKWEKEKQHLYKTVKHLEDKVERMEKDRKRNNIIITGLRKEPINAKTIQSFIKDCVEVETEVKNVYKISPSKNIITVEVESFDKKMEILKKKNKLRGSTFYIESELTAEERRIQAEIRKIARDKREEGKNVKVSYQKLNIDGEIYKWNKDEDGLVIFQAKND